MFSGEETLPQDCGHTLVVADDEQLCDLLSVLLARAGIATQKVSGGEEALRAVRAKRPALVLLDVCLPDINGYEVCRELKDEFGEELPIIFISGERTDPIDRVAGLLIGGNDYVVRPFDPSELLARVRRFIPHSSADSNATANAASNSAANVAMNLASNGPLNTPSHKMPPHDLTERELEVLQLLGEGRRPADIATKLVISRKTVASHIQRVLTKLGVNSQTQAVALAYRRGLIEIRSEYD